MKLFRTSLIAVLALAASVFAPTPSVHVNDPLALSVGAQAPESKGLSISIDFAFPEAQAGALSDYLENKLVDYVFRGQSFAAPGTVYVGLVTGACSDSSVGTEVSGGSYARIPVTSSTSNWAGTQAAASTTASSGTSGTTSNNNAIPFAAPTANWGTVVGFIVMDASSSGNLLICGTLTSSKTVNNGDAAPSFGTAQLTIQIDN